MTQEPCAINSASSTSHPTSKPPGSLPKATGPEPQRTAHLRLWLPSRAQRQPAASSTVPEALHHLVADSEASPHSLMFQRLQEGRTRDTFIFSFTSPFSSYFY